MARERLRQLNAQTQKVDQLTRENTILGTALAQSQDILSSYQELDVYDGEGGTQYSAAVPAMAPTRSGKLPAMPIQRPQQASMSRQSSSSGNQLPPVRSSIRRQDLIQAQASSPFQQPAPPTLRPHPQQGISEVDPITPRMRMSSQQPVATRRSTIAMVQQPSVRTSMAASSSQAQSASTERQAITANLRLPLPYVSALPQTRTQPALPTTEQQPTHPSTHGYSPTGAQAQISR